MGWTQWLTCSERGRAAVRGIEAMMAFSIAQQSSAVGVQVAGEPRDALGHCPSITDVYIWVSFKAN